MKILHGKMASTEKQMKKGESPWKFSGIPARWRRISDILDKSAPSGPIPMSYIKRWNLRSKPEASNSLHRHPFCELRLFSGAKQLFCQRRDKGSPAAAVSPLCVMFI